MINIAVSPLPGEKKLLNVQDLASNSFFMNRALVQIKKKIE